MSQSLAYGFQGQGPSDLYYRHSNRITLPGLILGAAIGIGIACICSIIYAYAVRWVTSEKLCAFLAIFFGAAMGASSAWVMHKLKVRNTKMMLLVVLLVSAVGYYLAWCVWLSILPWHTPHSALDLLKHPGEVHRLGAIVLEHGTWSSGHAKEYTHGTELEVIWIAEALAIIGGALLVATGIAIGPPFCENCNEWAEKGLTLTTGLPPDPAQLKQHLESGDYAYIRTLPPANKASGKWLTFTHQGCLTCQNFHTLTVKQTTATYNKKGQIARKYDRVLVKDLLVRPEALEVLKSPAPRPA